MSDYTIQTKEAFTILAYGTRLPETMHKSLQQKRLGGKR